jgi:hypothetical protein
MGRESDIELIPEPWNTFKPYSELVDALNVIHIDGLKSLYSQFFGKLDGLPKKAELVRLIAQALSFSTKMSFCAWFNALPDLTQRLIHVTFYEEYVALKPLEMDLGISIVRKEKQYWQEEWHFFKEHKLSFFPIHLCNDQPCTSLPRFLRLIVEPWFPSRQVSLDDCLAAQPVAPVWDNSSAAPDSLPLVYDALCEQLEVSTLGDMEKNVRKGFGKKECVNLRKATGFAPFPAEMPAPDSVDLVARFVLIMSSFKPKRPDDGQEGIRALVSAFFSETTQYPSLQTPPDRHYLEYSMLLEHFSTTYLSVNSKEMPSARAVFRDLLHKIAADGRCFDANKLAGFIKRSGKAFCINDFGRDRDLRLNAESITVNELTYSISSHETAFSPQYTLHFPLLVRPLFKAYCYLFASLGLLEITQMQPALARAHRGSATPISPYDSLATIRVTAFGRWCLGLTEERPVKPAQQYEAIADKELFLVTVKGSSLERTLYLDHIGVKLGEDRWRVSPATFISGCVNQHQIEDRIKRFKALIDPKPAPHWTQLFEKLLSRAGLFDTPRDDVLVYNLPEDRESSEELLRDPALKHIAFRAEGRLLVVPTGKERAFFALLAEHGIAHF